MERLAHRLRPTHGDGRRQKRVDSAYPRRQRTLDRRLEMHHLSGGMHAGVGASGANHGDLPAGDMAQRRFQFVLNRTAARLRLPAAQGATVVLHTQGNTHGDTYRKQNKASPASSPAMTHPSTQRTA